MIQDFADWLVYGLFGLIERLRNYLMTHKMYGLQYRLASILVPSHRSARAHRSPFSSDLSRVVFHWA